ncbi:14866_t:CDS:2 [Dentiscutata heterogama]|uniref:14866_t:CDS:1 n=1 Tax=Dentiscutata heterogama TaxID=1316150 RepID=A0ACA9MFX7_9GLOM|nr:14866_t:CDS:2 [Dentiscutata heterogama]
MWVLNDAPEDINDIRELEVQLCEFFAIAKKADGLPYSVNSLLATIHAINRKTKDLTEKGYSETHESDSLSFEEIQFMLQH